MYQKEDINQLVAQVLAEMMLSPCSAQKSCDTALPESCDEAIEDIAAPTLQEQFFVPHAINQEGYMAIKQHTPARLGVWRAGPRYNTVSLLRFRADHATACDSVFTDVSEKCIESNGFVPGQSRCADRDEYVTRPDLGRLLSDETKAEFKNKLSSNAKVVVMVGDGLSSAAIEANVADVIPAITQGLKSHGIDIGPIPFVKYCRVAAMEDLAELISAELVCCLIGERPGLVTSESMSAYIAYKPTIGMPESRRTVVSNIHKGGTPSVEAGAYIADLIKKMLDMKMSGVELNL